MEGGNSTCSYKKYEYSMVRDRKTHYLRTKKTHYLRRISKKKILLFANRKPIICEQKNGFFRIKNFFYSLVRDRKTHYLRTKKPIICDESCLSYYLRTTKTPYLRIKKNPYLRTPCSSNIYKLMLWSFNGFVDNIL